MKIKNIQIDFYSNKIKGQILKEFSIIPYPENRKIIYKNLIESVSHKKEDLIISFDKFNNKHIIDINFQNIRICYLRRYLEEIIAFKDEIINDMSKAKIKLGVQSSQYEKNVKFVFIIIPY